MVETRSSTRLKAILRKRKRSSDIYPSPPLRKSQRLLTGQTKPKVDQSQRPRPTLMGLPQEIREKIYAYLIPSLPSLPEHTEIELIQTADPSNSSEHGSFRSSQDEEQSTGESSDSEDRVNADDSDVGNFLDSDNGVKAEEPNLDEHLDSDIEVEEYVGVDVNHDQPKTRRNAFRKTPKSLLLVSRQMTMEVAPLYYKSTRFVINDKKQRRGFRAFFRVFLTPDGPSPRAKFIRHILIKRRQYSYIPRVRREGVAMRVSRHSHGGACYSADLPEFMVKTSIARDYLKELNKHYSSTLSGLETIELTLLENHWYGLVHTQSHLTVAEVSRLICNEDRIQRLVQVLRQMKPHDRLSAWNFWRAIHYCPENDEGPYQQLRWNDYEFKIGRLDLVLRKP